VKRSTSLTLLLTLLLLVGCGSRSLEDFREEGEQTTRSLVAELRQIHTRQELINASPKLKPLFNKLAVTMIAAREFQRTYPDQERLDLHDRDHGLSDQLRSELNRLYQLDGGREIIEKCEEDALKKLSL
jgi:hypothetical protein